MSTARKKEKTPETSVITRDPYPNSEKVYVDGKIHDIKVSMREISVDDDNGNSKLTVYDTSGPYTDPNIEIDVHSGLPRLREDWINKRDDVEELKEFTSKYAKIRAERANGISFKSQYNPLKAKPGLNVTQMHKKGDYNSRNGIHRHQGESANR